jgi:hypothetical protein
MTKLWHPTIDAYEIHGTYQLQQNDKQVTSNVTVMVDKDDYAQFIEDLIVNRYTVVINLVGGEANFTLYPTQFSIVHDRGKYDALYENTSLNPQNYNYVTITYTNDMRVEATIFGQNVLIKEEFTFDSEYHSVDYTELAWEDDPTEPIINPEILVPRVYNSMRVDMTIERLNILQDETFTVGTGTYNAMDALLEMSSTVNDDTIEPLYFWTLQGTDGGPGFYEEMIKVEVKDMRQVQEINVPGTSGNYYWWTVQLSFHVRITGWNKFYRTGLLQLEGGYFYTVVRDEVGTGSVEDSDRYRPYEPEEYISRFLSST